MRHHQLLAAGRATACAYCAAEIAASACAWWIAEENTWACTTCLPANEGTSHSVSYAHTTDARRYTGLF